MKGELPHADEHMDILPDQIVSDYSPYGKILVPATPEPEDENLHGRRLEPCTPDNQLKNYPYYTPGRALSTPSPQEDDVMPDIVVQPKDTSSQGSVVYVLDEENREDPFTDQDNSPLIQIRGALDGRRITEECADDADRELVIPDHIIWTAQNAHLLGKEFIGL